MRKSMTYGVLPSREEFEAAFERVLGPGNAFSFGNDPRVGTVELTCSELWGELMRACAEYIGPTGLATRAEEDAAGQWCSDMLGVLGFEWV